MARHDREWHEREGAKARAECNVLRSEKAKLEARLSEADAKLAVHEQRVQHGLDVLGVESIEKLVQRFTNEQKETDVDQRKNDRALSEPCTGRAFWQQRTYESQDEYGRKKLRMPQHKWRVTSTEPDAETEGAYWYEATCKCCLRTVRDWWPSASEALRSGMRFKRSALVGLGIPERTPMPYRVAGVGLRLAWGTLSTFFRWIFWPLKRVGKKFSGNASEGLKTAAVSVAVTAWVLVLVGSSIYFAVKRDEKCFTPAAEGSAIGTITEVQSDGGSGYYLLYLDNGTRWRVRTEGARMLQVGDTGYVCKESLWHWKERPADEPGAKVDAERAEDF